MEENRYSPSPFIFNHIPFFQDVLRRQSSCQGMKKILEDVPPDSDAAKEWTGFCDELEAMYNRGWDLIQKHGPYIDECHKPRMERLEDSMDEIRKKLPPKELFLGQGWVVKKPNGEQIGKPDLRPQTVNKALADAGPGSYAEPTDWETNESDIQIYAPPTEQERDALGADERPKDRLVFRVERQPKMF